MVSVVQSPRKGLQSEAEVLDFAGSSVGAIHAHRNVSRSGSTNRVCVLTTRAGEDLIAKWFTEAPGYFHSVDALSQYTKPLGAKAPRLIDQHDGLKLILMTMLPGHTATPQQAADPVVMFHAGQLVRQFHESAPATRSAEVTRDIAHELSSAIDRAEHALGPFAAAELRACAMDVLDSGPLTLHPTHGGLRPEHWLVDANYGTQLLSFSASQYDPWIVDTLELERDYWGYSPRLRDAFYSGYDAHPDEGDLAILRAYQATRALNDWLAATQAQASKKTLTLAWSRLEQVVGATLF